MRSPWALHDARAPAFAAACVHAGIIDTDLSSASAVIYRVQEMQQRQLQLESDLCAAKNEAAAATAAGAVLIAQMSSANKFQQQLQVEQQDLLRKLGQAEAAVAAAVAAAAARDSVVKMFDFEKFVEVWRE